MRRRLCGFSTYLEESPLEGTTFCESSLVTTRGWEGHMGVWEWDAVVLLQTLPCRGQWFEVLACFQLSLVVCYCIVVCCCCGVCTPWGKFWGKIFLSREGYKILAFWLWGFELIRSFLGLGSWVWPFLPLFEYGMLYVYLALASFGFGILIVCYVLGLFTFSLTKLSLVRH